MNTYMKYYCINLKHAAERRQHCQQQFEREGLNVTFVRGFDGRASSLHHQQGWITCQVGVCISHIMLVEEIRHSRCGPVVIFEDDPILEEGFEQKLLACIETLPAGWHVAAISWFTGNTGAHFEAENQHWQKFISGDVWGQCCYIVNGSTGAEKVLDCITPIRSHIDRMFWECCRDGLMNGYFLIDPLVKPNWDFKSQNI